MSSGKGPGGKGSAKSLFRTAGRIVAFTAVFLVLVALVNKDLSHSVDVQTYSDVKPVMLQGRDEVSFEVQRLEGRRNIGLSIQFATYARINRSSYRLEISSPDGEILSVREIDASLVQDNSYLTIPVPMEGLAAGETYTFRFIALDVPEDQALAIYMGRIEDVILQGATTLNGVPLDRYPVLKVVLADSALFLLLLAALYLGGLVILLMPKKRLEWVAAAMILVFGTFLCLLDPIGNAPDEYAHSARAYYVADLRFGFPITDEVPFLAQEEKALFSDRKLPLGEASRRYAAVEGDELFRGFSGLSFTSAYSSLSYLPSALGVFLAKLLRLPIWVVYYCGRIFNLLAYLALVFLAIRRTPHYKTSFMVLALSPLSLFLAASYSQDGILLGLALLAFAWFFHLCQPSEKPHAAWRIWLLAGLLVLPALGKLPYLVLVVLLPFVPVRHFSNIDKARRFKIVATVVSSLAMLLWAYAALFLLSSEGGPVRVPQADAMLQIAGMLASPLRYAYVLVRSTLNMLNTYLSWFTTLGWMDLALPYITFLAPVLVIVSFLRDPRPALWPRSTRYLLLGVFLGGFALIATAMYVTWTPVGASYIEGVQTRYLVPLLPLLLPMVRSGTEPTTPPVETTRFDARVAALLTGMLVYAVLMVMQKYYN